VAVFTLRGPVTAAYHRRRRSESGESTRLNLKDATIGLEMTIKQRAAWPLRMLGLDPGRALANAAPSPERRNRERDEQLAAIRQRLNADRDRAPLPGSTGLR
jgi:hypothetical protein